MRECFNPVDAEMSAVKIYDTEDESVKIIIQNYHTVIQNLRLIKRPRQNHWSQQNRKWSEVALGQDRKSVV